MLKCAAAALFACAAVAASAETKPSAQDDINCAAWAAFMSGMSEEPVQKEGFSYGMSYFLGRYEVVSDETVFVDAFTAAVQRVTQDQASFDAADAACLPRFEAFVARLDAWNAADNPATPADAQPEG